MLNFGKTTEETLDRWKNSFARFEMKKGLKLFLTQFFFQVMVATALTTSIGLSLISGSQEILVPALVFAGVTATVDFVAKSVGLVYFGHSGAIITHVFWGMKWLWLYSLVSLLGYIAGQFLGAGLAHLIIGGSLYTNATIKVSTPGIEWYGAFIIEIIVGFMATLVSYISPIMGASPQRSLLVGGVNGSLFLIAAPISGAGLCVFRWLGTNIWKISVLEDVEQLIYPGAAACAILGLVFFAWMTNWIKKKKNSSKYETQ